MLQRDQATLRWRACVFRRQILFLDLRISFFFKEFVLAFSGFILEPLKGSDSLPGIFRAVRTAYDGQLIPSLFDDIAVGPSPVAR